MPRFKMKSLGFSILLLLAIGVLAACGGSGNTAPTAAPPRPADEVVVVMGVNSEPAAGFDPCYGWGAGEHVHEPLIQSTLLVTDHDMSLNYDLATAYDISPDGLTWTVTIRDDARFTDGEPVTAADVAFTYQTVKAHTSVNDLSMLDSCEATDPYTVVFHMVQPCSTFAYTMTVVGILPQHAYSSDYALNPIGSGRYKLKQWDRGQQVILVANDDYYGPAPRIKKVTILFMSEDAAFAAAKAGLADIAYTAASYSDQSLPGMKLAAYASVDNRGMSMPVNAPGAFTAEGYAIGHAVTSDLSIRRALAYGLDREAMAKAVLNGYGTPAYSVCDGLPWYNPASAVSYDPQRAVSLLEAAGWLPGGDGIRVKDGVTASFTLLYPSGDSVRQALAMEIANQAVALGISVKPSGIGWDDADALVWSTPMLYGWGANNPMELYNLYYSGVPSNKPGYERPTVNAYMDAALAADSVELSHQYWQQAQWDGEIGITPQGDYPWVWLVNIEHLYWVKDGLNVAQQKIHPHGHGWSLVNNIDAWYWE